MAARLVSPSTQLAVLACQRARVAAFMPGMQNAVRHFRAFSSYDEQQAAPNGLDLDALVNKKPLEWPDTYLGPISPQDPRFPLPGIAGPLPKNTEVQAAEAESKKVSSILDEPPHQVRQMSMLKQFLNTVAAEEVATEEVLDGYNAPLLLECVAMECPDLLKNDLQELFPEYNLSEQPLTVITLSQQTQHDMTMWSPEVDEEREGLLSNFIESASDICNSIHKAGYWADFIDPSSGRPYLGAYTNATLFETDDRYRHFGFEINDLGCCKVISHHLWGTNTYVGCLFTSAPVNHPIIQRLSIQ